MPIKFTPPVIRKTGSTLRIASSQRRQRPTLSHGQLGKVWLHDFELCEWTDL